MRWVLLSIFITIQVKALATAYHNKDNERSANTNQQQIHFSSSSAPSNSDYNPLGPLVYCSFLPDEFMSCQPPIDHKGNQTAKDEMNGMCDSFALKSNNFALF